jgi:hypothetical protein
MDRPARGPQAAQQSPALRRIVCLSFGHAKRHGRSRIRGNQMNLGVPSAAGLADGLRAFFLNGAIGLDLDAGGVQLYPFDLDAQHLLALQLIEHAASSAPLNWC